MQEPLNNEFSLSECSDLIDEVLDSGGEFTLYPKGTSMRPLIRQGSDAVVLIKAKQKLKRFDIPLYIRSNGQYVLHRVIKIFKNGTYGICGDNQFLIEKGIKDSQIKGVICAVIRDGKRINTSNTRYKIYVLIWCFMPLRHLLLKTRSLLYKVKAKLKKII